MRLFTPEDLKDIYIKFHQRGFSFLLSKLSLDSSKRTKSAFNEKDLESSNYWLIPAVRERWNFLITGDKNTTYEEYFSKKYFSDQKKLKVLALGSGVCSHEIRLATLNPNWEVHCFDFSNKLLEQAKEISDKKGLQNIHYFAENALTYHFLENEYDLVFFHASLHHFNHIHNFFAKIINKTLKKNGYLIINEYVGKKRMLFDKTQIKSINNALKKIPVEFKKIYKTNLLKTKYYGSGLVRMYIADPSECVDSENILPTIHHFYNIIEEKEYGNNLLANTLKDIAHHFVHLNKEKQQVLEELFKTEDEFLKSNKSDFIVGIYTLKPEF